MEQANSMLDKMERNQKVNYDKVLQQLIKTWESQAERPKILLHSCCAPCSTYSLEYLSEYADVTILFANSNIHPESEYRRREIVQKEFVAAFNERTNNRVGFMSSPYKPEAFMRMVGGNQLQNEPEGGKRCTACFQMRLDIVAEQALTLDYDYFGSALTLSPKKNSQLINAIGFDIQKIYDVNYLPSDFKKNNGYKRSIDMCREYDIYRQCYCGCVFAAKQQGINLKEIGIEADDFLIEKNKPTFTGTVKVSK